MKSAFVPDATLVDLLRRRAAVQGDKTAYRFLTNGEHEEATLSYAQLDRQARAIAALLQAYESSGQTALLLYPPGLDYIAAFFGCLYAGVTAVPTYPPRRNRPDARLREIVKDAKPPVALTLTQSLSELDELLIHEPELQNLRWLSTDDIDLTLANNWRHPPLSGDSLAFLQYTSGSTGTPKGVMVSHTNLLYNQRMIQRAFNTRAEHNFLSWLPLYHDMGLIGGIIQPLYLGSSCTLMAPVAFLQKPLRWLQAITRYRPAVTGGPNFGFDLCTRRLSDEQVAEAGLDLSSWRIAINGAEPIRSEVLDAFVAKFGPYGFRRETFLPSYGMAEATLIITGGEHDAPYVVQGIDSEALKNHRPAFANPGDKTLVGCGRALLEQQVLVVNPDTCIPCPTGIEGEVWVQGPNVARGYWQRNALTVKTFHAQTESGAGPFLRSGDLGVLREDGELFITGRLKDLIIVRGQNHYPQDIEYTVEHCHPALLPTSSAAFTVEINGEERLVVAAEVERRYHQPRRTHDKEIAVPDDQRIEQHRRSELSPLAPDSLDSPPALGIIIQTVRQMVAEEHGLQVYGVLLVKVGHIPKTSSGKIRRHACRDGFLHGSLEVVASDLLESNHIDDSSDSEELTRELLENTPKETRKALLVACMQKWLAEILQVPKEQLDWQQSLSRLGIDSLQAVELQHRLGSRLGLSWSPTRFLEGPSIAELAEEGLAQLNQQRDQVSQARALEAWGQSGLSYNQQALWFLHELEPDSAAYNVFFAVKILSPLDIPAMERTFSLLVERHPILRTNYPAVQGEPVQQLIDSNQFRIRHIDARTWSDADIQHYLSEAGHSPFNLASDFLLRVHMLKRADNRHLLLLSVHHIGIDLWSMLIVLDELLNIYPAELVGMTPALPVLTHTYGDYVREQAAKLHSEWGGQAKAYWHQQLHGPLPVLNFPTDRPRPALQTYRGRSHSFQVSAKLTQKLRKLGQSCNATLYMTLMAALQVLLCRYSGQDDILVGSPSAGRNRREFRNVVGYFVNLIALRGDLSGNPSFAEFLQQIQATTLDALKYQEYPFQLLVKHVLPERDSSRHPIVQVTFGLQQPHRLKEAASFVLKEDGAQMDAGGLRVQSIGVEQRIAQFDLTLIMVKVDKHLDASMEYNADLFDAGSIERFCEYFQILLDAIADNPGIGIHDYSILGAERRHQLLCQWSQAERIWSCLREQNSHDSALPIQPSYALTPLPLLQQRISDYARTQPEAVALILNDQQLSYAELEQHSNQLAHHLRSLGVGPEVRVGIGLPRGIDVFVAVLAVLKAGGAYVPLDLAYPPERLSFMLDDAQVAVLISLHAIAPQLPSQATPVYLDQLRAKLASYPVSAPDCAVQGDTLAYMIYTSGSTGIPKGVQIEQANLSHLAQAQITRYGVSSTSRLLQFVSFSFDVATGDWATALGAGAALVLMDDDSHSNLSLLPSLLAQQAISHLQIPVSVLAALPYTELPALQAIIAGGDHCPPEVVARWGRGRRFFNAYGPTETTVCATAAECDAEAAQLPHYKPTIGRPLDNVLVLVLDPYLQPLPIGVHGELYIAGAGVGRGYWQRPELNQERFVELLLDHHLLAVLPEQYSLTANPIPLRAYRTGDLVRWCSNGELEFVGRVDQQVKIRGFRIELGEIETVLRQHPYVHDCVAIAAPGDSGDKRLLAYVAATQPDTSESNQDAQQIAYWQTLYEQNYSGANAPAQLDADFFGWNSSYDQQPIALSAMHEWRDTAVTRILALQPRRVLEIGCGSGLILSHIAPHCEAYHATDFSAAALAKIKHLAMSLDLPQVTLAQQSADDFSAIANVDTIIINSVVQYFPSLAYLLSVIEKALHLVTPGGAIFLGDIRNLTLLEAFHAEVQRHQAPADAPRSQVQQLLQRRVNQEEELLIDPQFFYALPSLLPAISSVDVQLKQGQHHNELTQFRYEVVLRVKAAPLPAAPEARRLDWHSEALSLDDLRHYLNDQQVLELRNIPNARLHEPLRTLAWLRGEVMAETLGQWRTLLSNRAKSGIEPQAVWLLAQELGYQAYLTWSRDLANFDAFLAPQAMPFAPPLTMPTVQIVHREALAQYANNPLQNHLTAELVPQLRNLLQASLPDYMQPSHIMVLGSLPLTPSGKVDRRALPQPEETQLSRTQFVAPRTQAERLLAEIWAEVLGLPQVGIQDNFFELGGDSILSIQVVARANQAGLVISPKQLFQAQTIAELAQIIEASTTPSHEVSAISGQVPLTPIQHRFFAQQYPYPAHHNHALLLQVPADFSLNAAQQALALVLENHDALRLHFTAEGQFNRAHLDVLIDTVDLRASADPAAELTRQASLIQTHLDLSRQLLRVVYCEFGNGQPGRLLWVLHQLLADHQSGWIIIEDWLHAYLVFKTGQTPRLPPKTSAFKHWADYLRQQANCADAANHLERWQAPFELPPLPQDMPSSAADTVAHQALVSIRLSKADTDALLTEVTAAYNTDLYDALLCALLHAWWTPRLHLDLMRDGRAVPLETLDLSRSVGWFNYLVPLYLDLPAQQPIVETLKAIKEALRQLPRHGLDYGLLRYLCANRNCCERLGKQPDAPVLLQHQGAFSPHFPAGFGLADEDTGPSSHPDNPRPYRLSIQTRIDSGCLAVDFAYSDTQYHRETIAALATRFTQALNNLIEHCRHPTAGGYTPSDFPEANLDQAELDDLLDGLDF